MLNNPRNNIFQGDWAPRQAEKSSQPTPPPLLPARLPLLRPQQGRLLGGVCRGISLHLGVNVSLIRLAMILLVCAFGTGLVGYIFLWIYVPAENPAAGLRYDNQPVRAQPLAKSYTKPTESTYDASKSNKHSPQNYDDLSSFWNRTSKPLLLAGIGALLLALALSFSTLGVPQRLIFPAIFLCSSMAVAWFHYEDDHKHGWVLLVSGGLILASLASYIFPVFPFVEAVQMMLLAFVVILVVAVIMAPWASGMLTRLSSERAQKEREEERADMAAHLHDGVLQTLALIQLHADEPQTVFTLARGQERDLRNWLYQERTPSDRSVSSGIQAIVAQIEDVHGKPIDVVNVGDAHPSAQTDALLDATQQALINAVTHGAEPISVYCEANKNKVEVFVRDHGNGFDIKSIPPDRLGIRESIIGRIERRGGTVEIVSRPNWGTEVRMHMPISLASNKGKQDSETAPEDQAQSSQ